MRKPLIQKKLFFNGDEDISNMVHITLLPKDLALYWQRCGLTADFGASFASFCFPKIESARNALSFILNELVENAVKYSSEESKRIKITLCEIEHNLYFEVENYVTTEQREIFTEQIDILMSSNDIEKSYMAAMERSMTGEESKLGLLTILNDYKVGLSFTFKDHDDKHLFDIVKLQVKITPEDILC